MEKMCIPRFFLVLGILGFIHFEGSAANESLIPDPIIESNKTLLTDTEVNERKLKALCYCGVPGTPADAANKEGGRGAKIQGGWYARRLKYRWQVLVLKDNQVWTGGALINDRHIVTSAYWFKGQDIKKFKVVLNEYNRTVASDTVTVTSTLRKITLHPKFNSDTWDYDVAVLEMTDPVTLGSSTEPKINPICLTKYKNKYKFDDGDRGTVTGWGAMTTASNAPPSAVLMGVELPILSNKVCSTHYSGITDRMMCAGVPQGGKGPLNYDDGGPFQYKGVDGRYTLIGVTSYVKEKNAKGREAIFTRITEVRDWIGGTPTNGAQWCENDY